VDEDVLHDGRVGEERQHPSASATLAAAKNVDGEDARQERGPVEAAGEDGGRDARAGAGQEMGDASSVNLGAAGTTSARLAKFGANTPWYLVRWRRGGGISVARRPRNSRGVRTS
jgi:hypothetical protein